MCKTILVPIDVNHADLGEAMIPVAARHMDADTRLILLNVVEEIPEWAAHELPPGLVKASYDKAIKKLQGIAAASDLAIEVQVHIGHAYQTILDIAETEQADLIVIASHRPGWQDYFLGSTATKVVQHARCSVMVVR